MKFGRIESHRFDFRPSLCQVTTTLGKLLTHLSLSPSSIICTSLNARKVTAVCGRCLTYHPH